MRHTFPHNILSQHGFGTIIGFDDSVREYRLEPGQLFIPHTIHPLAANIHPFNAGDIVMVLPSLSDINGWFRGVSVCKIDKIRWFKDSRKHPAIPQVEILGLPLHWFAASHFSL